MVSDGNKDFNGLLGHDRVIVENFFGRMKKYREISAYLCRCKRDSIEILARIYIYLTNFKLIAAHLRTIKEFHDPMLVIEEDPSPSQGFLSSPTNITD